MATVLRVAIIDPGNRMAGAFLDDYGALWADPGLALFGIGTVCGDDDVLDSSLGFKSPSTSASGF